VAGSLVGGVIVATLLQSPESKPPAAPAPASPAQTAPPAPPAAAAKTFRGVDLFGTKRFTIESLRAALKEKLGGDFDAYEAAWVGEQFDVAMPLKKRLENAVKELGQFAFVDFSVIQYFEEGRPSYLTIDVVEREDAAARMAFSPKPVDALPDPGGLIALHEQYEQVGWELLRAGKLPPDEAAHQECQHAVFGFAHEKLAPFKEPLLSGAEKHFDELVKVLHRDRDEQHRAAAAFLLAFSKQGARVAGELGPACKDPATGVRNNALRVYAEMSRYHPEVELPVDIVLDCLEFPTTTDRNKASAILAKLSEKPELRDRILARSGATLLAMLALQQPNNHDFAWIILKNLSHEDFGEHDVAAWQRWLDEELSTH
jgi:hypothetical protein